MREKFKLLAIETSCDETCAAITEGVNILSNVVWSQAKEHAKYGGVMPSEAKRLHEERIDWVIDRALRQARCDPADIGAVAVTMGPGLAIALEVGIAWSKKLAYEWRKQLIAVNHIEGHVLSPLARNSQFSITNDQIAFPCLALVVSGGHTELIRVEKIGQYKILAQTMDDALGEALDKAARMLGLPYPGGAELEKAAFLGNPKAYPLPLRMMGRENKNGFSYSGLKTAFFRLISKIQDSRFNADLAAVFQDRAFTHLTRVLEKSLERYQGDTGDLLVGGGVSLNQNLRSRLNDLGKKVGLEVRFADKSLCGDNAAMVGIAGGFKAQRGEFSDPDKIDRRPRWRIDELAN